VLSRIFSTVLLWGIVFASLWAFGVHAAVALITLLTVLTLHEFYGMTAKLGLRPFRKLGLAAAALMVAGPFYLRSFEFGSEIVATAAPAVLALGVVAFCVRLLGERDNSNRIESLAASAFGLLYIPFLLHFLVRLLLLTYEPTDPLFVLFPPLEPGLVACLWVVAVSKFCDVGALLSGMAFGRHKMSPNISPKKTWEGAIGGVFISAGVGAGVAALGADYLPFSMTPLVGALMAVPIALATIVSDLIESVMKRRADVKDSGAMIPGIGGAFDLTDSLILTAPVAFLLFLFLS
jgi:phosphatidate cytidylyltransferase